MTRAGAASAAILLAVHLLAAFADFFAPYGPREQHREFPWSPPARIGLSGFRPVARMTPEGPDFPIRFLPRDGRGWHLFGVDPPARIFILGSDGLGRDQFSRLLHGARISLFSGMAAAAVSALLGLCLGGSAGYFGGWADSVLMRLAEVFLALPWMYLLLAVRAFFPLRTEPGLIFVALIVLLGAIGWARPARLVRATVLSVKEREYVLAARGFGAGPLYILRRHIAPETFPVLLTYMSLAIPQYVLAETTLSFAGLGVSGSTASWGALLAPLASLEVLANYWWMWLPAAGLAVVFACYARISNALAGSDAARV